MTWPLGFIRSTRPEQSGWNVAAYGPFDIVFCSYGVLCWLPDLTRWGEIVAHYLEPGGIFYIAEAHPFIRVFPMDNDITDAISNINDGITLITTPVQYIPFPVGAGSFSFIVFSIIPS